MTQEDVSKAMHVSRNTVVNWENGRVVPSFATMQTLADLYGVSIDNLILPEKST